MENQSNPFGSDSFDSNPYASSPDPGENSVGSSKPPHSTEGDSLAIAALVLGIVGIIAWCLPLCGCPVNIAGLVVGSMGMKSVQYRNLAIAGLVLAVLGALLTVGNAIVGVILATQGQHPFAPPP